MSISTFDLSLKENDLLKLIVMLLNPPSQSPFDEQNTQENLPILQAFTFNPAITTTNHDLQKYEKILPAQFIRQQT